MATPIRAYAARQAKGKLERFDYDPGELGPEEVEIAVQYCGLCHSDLSMLNNEWGMTQYPFVPGHEVAGRIVAAGPGVKARAVGEIVGLGWYAQSCMHCKQCMGGDHNLCPEAVGTIIGRHGGFADRVRCHWAWATPLPGGMDTVYAGPLFCGGVTVFNPIIQNDVKPTFRVGVIGIGGLGHIALQLLNKWGCHVTAFTSSASKIEEAKKLGAHATADSKDEATLKKLAGTFDFILSTVNAPLEWNAVLGTLGPRGKLHLVGAVLEPIPLQVMSLLAQQKSITATPLGSPNTTASLLDFCVRHDVKPMIEKFPMSKINEAFERLESGKARYRIVLENDLG